MIDALIGTSLDRVRRFRERHGAWQCQRSSYHQTFHEARDGVEVFLSIHLWSPTRDETNIQHRGPVLAAVCFQHATSAVRPMV